MILLVRLLGARSISRGLTAASCRYGNHAFILRALTVIPTSHLVLFAYYTTYFLLRPINCEPRKGPALTSTPHGSLRHPTKQPLLHQLPNATCSVPSWLHFWRALSFYGSFPYLITPPSNIDTYKGWVIYYSKYSFWVYIYFI